MLKLIIGGTASGKSEYAEAEAEALCRESGKPMLYIATLKEHSKEAAHKIKKHRMRRAHLDHITAECYDAASLKKEVNKAGNKKVILFDSLDGFLACSLGDLGIFRDACEKTVNIIKKAAVDTDIVVVCDTVFSDGEVYDSLTMEFIAALGGALKKLTEFAGGVTEVVCGIPISLRS